MEDDIDIKEEFFAQDSTGIKIKKENSTTKECDDSDLIESAVDIKKMELQEEIYIWNSFEGGSDSLKMDIHAIRWRPFSSDRMTIGKFPSADKITEEIVFECNVCSAKFAFRGDLNRHAKIHNGGKLFECDVCLAKFAFRGYLKRHVKIHTGRKSYECDVCKVKFKLGRSLTSHMSIHTGEKAERKVCDDKFKFPSAEKRITEDIVFACEVCPAKFAFRCDLNRHIKNHTGEKPFECDVCKVKFKHGSRLTSHMKIHTGEKPYECQVCSAKFRCPNNLKVHMRRHTGEKPYVCEICDDKFTYYNGLKIHLRRHSEGKL